MTVIIGISLLIGAVVGLLLGVPLGRFLERIRPSKDEDESPKKKKKKFRR
ncbi:MAG: hypothetical protein AB8I08_34905 [Sandaracinaceae bacterium]